MGSNEKPGQVSNSQKDAYSIGLFGVEPRVNTEAYRVKEEVSKRKRIAQEKGVPDLISELYFGEIEYYPSWITHEGREYVPNVITKATRSEKEEDDKTKKVTGFTLNSNDYRFEFSEDSFGTPDGEWNTHGLLELFQGEQRVLALICSLNTNDIDSEWRQFDIEAFIDGDWVNDFQLLKQEKKKQEYERELKRAEDPEKVDKLKKDFGIS